MALLGFDAIGTLPIGTVPDAGSTPVALTGRSAAMGRARAGVTAASALTAKSAASGRARVALTSSSALTGRSAAQVKMRSPAGAILYGRSTGQVKVKAPGGLILRGTSSSMNNGVALLHLEIKNTPPRRALLLSSASVTASYWRGHS